MNYYKKIVNVLLELGRAYPECNLGKHIATAVDSSSTKDDLWGMSDKEIFDSLKEYQLAKELDFRHDESELDRIISDGMHLNRILENDEHEEDYR